MIRVLGILRDLSPEKMLAYEYYRVFLPLKEVARRCEDIDVTLIDIDRMAGFPDSAMSDYDLCVTSRLYGGNALGFAEVLRNAGAQWLYDADDDLSEDERQFKGNGQAFKEALGLVDRLTVTTPYLAERLGRYTQGAPTVIPNYIDSVWFARTAARARRFVPGLTAGFSGTATHIEDWRGIHQFLRQMEGITPIAHGFCPDYMRAIPGLVYIGRVPYAGYPAILAQFDILMCGLDVKDRWNWGKSDIKPIEAMAVGAVAVCSDTLSYRALAEAGAPIILVESVGDWASALEEARGRREELRTAGPEWVRGHRDIEMGWEQWASAYR